jgi:hypothetical protein
MKYQVKDSINWLSVCVELCGEMLVVLQQGASGCAVVTLHDRAVNKSEKVV